MALPIVFRRLSGASVSVTAKVAVDDTKAARDIKQTLDASTTLQSASSLQNALSDAGLPGVAVASAPNTEWCCNPAGAFGDPHITFANGGKADFRGESAERASMGGHR